MTISLEMFARVCADQDALRPHLNAPFGFTIDGDRWTVATDGTRLLAVRHDFGAPDYEKPENIGTLLGFHAAAFAVGGAAIETGPIREFFAMHAPPPPGACPVCNGSAAKDCDACGGDGDVDCECLDCGDTHTRQCSVCRGNGAFLCSACRDRHSLVRVRIDDTTFDARRIGPLMAAIPEGAAMLHAGAPSKLWTLAGDGWFAVFMPLRPSENDARTPLPHFTTGAIANA